MKLLHHTYYKLMLFLLLLLLVWGTLFYYSIWYEVVDETNDTLRNDSEILINTALHDPSFLETSGGLLSFYSFRPITEEEGNNYRESFYESTVYIDIEDEYEPVRVMKTAFRMHDGQYYELELKISTLERDNMARAIVGYLLALFVVFVVCTLVGTRLVLKRAFSPLNRLMDWLHSLQPGKPLPPLEGKTNIREFRQLSDAAVEMGNRAFKAYAEQKEFIENASHELQTPLAIARGKVELLAETPLDEAQMRELDELQTTLGRAVRLNKALLLLMRIENGQYVETEKVNLDDLLDELLPDLLDIYAHKELHVTRQRDEKYPFCVHCHSGLAHILLTNLLKNALLHTPEGGEVSIISTARSLQIRNTGTAALDADALFHRFYRSSDGRTDSTGLGLAIAQSIARTASLTLTYRWKQGMHVFELTT
jgi:signal transduction histidine kinase